MNRAWMLAIWSLVIASASFADAPPSAASPGATLDELLQIPGPAPSRPAAPAGGDTGLTDKVEEALSAREAQDAFAQAVREMRVVSERLGGGLDPGIDTQRMQEAILAKLDQVIDAAQQQQKQQQQSGQSSGQASAQPPDQGSDQNQGQSGAQQTGGEAQAQTGAAGNRGGVKNPQDPGQAEAAGPIAENRQEWGNLPARLREQLLQGLEERFSPVYQDLTEAYYRRLAEEAP